MIIETDQKIPAELERIIKGFTHIGRVSVLNRI
jgi:hypothetical protein